MSKFSLLNFSYSETPFCCGMTVIGGFYDGYLYRGKDNRVGAYKDAVRDLRYKLVQEEQRPYEDDIDNDGTHEGCKALICTVLTSHEYKLKLLLDAGMVEVKRWTNVNTGNEIALLVSPNEWPELK